MNKQNQAITVLQAAFIRALCLKFLGFKPDSYPESFEGANRLIRSLIEVEL